MMVDALFSFAFIQKGQLDLSTLPGDWNILIDSGAFTNFTLGREVVKLDDYIAFLKSAPPRVWKYLNLDVLNNPEASEVNFKRMRAEGLSPVPVFQRGSPADELRRMLDENELVAIGGVAKAVKTRAEVEYVEQIMRIVGQRAVHLLGVSDVGSIRNHRPFSVDSSTWCAGATFGSLRLWTGTRFVYINNVLRSPRTISQAKLDALRMYVSDPSVMSEPEFWINRPADWSRLRGGIVTCQSFLRYARSLRRSIGTRYFFAVLPSVLPILLQAIAREKGTHAF